MATGPKRIKMEPEWIAQPAVVKQENVKSIKIKILDYQEQAEYGHMELHGEKIDFSRICPGEQVRLELGYTNF
ncbi:unnamed protein product [Caenorhabditis nigoni]